jgi:hypothetical protein
VILAGASTAHLLGGVGSLAPTLVPDAVPPAVLVEEDPEGPVELAL